MCMQVDAVNGAGRVQVGARTLLGSWTFQPCSSPSVAFMLLAMLGSYSLPLPASATNPHTAPVGLAWYSMAWLVQVVATEPFLPLPNHTCPNPFYPSQITPTPSAPLTCWVGMVLYAWLVQVAATNAPAPFSKCTPAKKQTPRPSPKNCCKTVAKPTCRVGLVLYAWLVQVVAADGTGVSADGPGPHGHRVPLLDLKALATLATLCVCVRGWGSSTTK